MQAIRGRLCAVEIIDLSLDAYKYPLWNSPENPGIQIVQRHTYITRRNFSLWKGWLLVLGVYLLGYLWSCIKGHSFPSEVFLWLNSRLPSSYLSSSETRNVTDYLKMIFIGNGDAQKGLEAGFCLPSKGNLMLVLASFSGVKRRERLVSAHSLSSLPCKWRGPWSQKQKGLAHTLHRIWDFLAALEGVFPYMIDHLS